MGNFIELIEFNKRQIIVILVTLFNVITYFLKTSQIHRYTKNKKYSSNYFDKDDDYQKMAVLPFFFNILSPKILLVIIFLIIKYRKKYFHDLISIDNRVIRNNNNANNKYHKITMILIIFILEIIYRFESLKVYNRTNYIDMKLTIYFLVPVLSFFILKDQVHRHHFFSFIFSSISIIIICIILTNFYKTLKKEYYDEEETYFSDQMKHLSYSIFPALASILIKYLFENYNISFFEFLLYDGILSFIFPFLLMLLKSMVEGKKCFKKNLRGFRYLFYNERKSISLFFFTFFFSSGYYLTKYLTLYYFSPNILVSFETLSLFFRWFCEFIAVYRPENNKDKIVAIKFVGALIIFISSLIYNEILVLHFCDCDKEIKKKININRNMINYIDSQNVPCHENLNNMILNNQN